MKSTLSIPARKDSLLFSRAIRARLSPNYVTRLTPKLQNGEKRERQRLSPVYALFEPRAKKNKSLMTVGDRCYSLMKCICSTLSASRSSTARLRTSWLLWSLWLQTAAWLVFEERASAAHMACLLTCWTVCSSSARSHTRRKTLGRLLKFGKSLHSGRKPTKLPDQMPRRGRHPHARRANGPDFYGSSNYASIRAQLDFVRSGCGAQAQVGPSGCGRFEEGVYVLYG